LYKIHLLIQIGGGVLMLVFSHQLAKSERYVGERWLWIKWLARKDEDELAFGWRLSGAVLVLWGVIFLLATF
jgi:hypothetical protein